MKIQTLIDCPKSADAELNIFAKETSFRLPVVQLISKTMKKKYEGLNIKNPTYLLYIVWGGRLLLFLISKLTDVSPKLCLCQARLTKKYAIY